MNTRFQEVAHLIVVFNAKYYNDFSVHTSESEAFAKAEERAIKTRRPYCVARVTDLLRPEQAPIIHITAESEATYE